MSLFHRVQLLDFTTIIMAFPALDLLLVSFTSLCCWDIVHLYCMYQLNPHTTVVVLMSLYLLLLVQIKQTNPAIKTLKFKSFWPQLNQWF